jgi:hypothetical protein
MIVSPVNNGLCAETTPGIRRGAYDALEVQKLPPHQTFYKACAAGSRGKMSEVQKHFV